MGGVGRAGSGAPVLVDPRLRLPYATPVLDGFRRLGVPVRFTRLDAPVRRGVAMSIEGVSVWLDLDDSAEVDADALAWADVAGKVNVTVEDARRNSRLLLLGPLFGVRAWPLPKGYLVLPSMIAAGAPLRGSLAGLRFQGITRQPIEAYRRSPSRSGYVFHRSRRWPDRHDATNRTRDRFAEAVGRCGLTIDGGLTDVRIPLSEYLARTAVSSVVFNCPAVHGCLGWKLGEYLALGKAIISTDLGRALPEPLVHGRDIHLVDDDVDAMADAIRVIDSDTEYRAHLERGAFAWYQRNLTPEVVARRVLTAARDSGVPT